MLVRVVAFGLFAGNWLKATCHIGLFFALFYFVLWNRSSRAWLRALLERIRYDSR